MVPGKLDLCIQKYKIRSFSYTVYKNQLGIDYHAVYLNLWPDTIQLLEQTTGFAIGHGLLEKVTDTGNKSKTGQIGLCQVENHLHQSVSIQQPEEAT